MNKLKDYLAGFCEAFNLFPTKIDGYPYNTSTEAIASDWKVVCDDLRKVMESEDVKSKLASPGNPQKQGKKPARVGQATIPKFRGKQGS